MNRPRFWLVGLCLTCSAAAFAQPATPEQRGTVALNPDFGTLHLQTKIGSFKLIDGQGRVEINFKGSIMLHKVEGKVEIGPGLRKEFEGHGRTVYSGTGKIVVTGKFRGIQWFGRDMSTVWYGAGVARLSGAFDRDLNTGKFWFSDPAKKSDWMAAGTFDIHVPTKAEAAPVKPVERGKSGG